MILIVDDEKDAVQILSAILKENGYEVSGCYEGRSALIKAKKTKLKAAILDYNLQDMDGLSVLKKLFKIQPNLKVIMISADPDPELEKKAKDGGAFAFVSKPFNLKKLLAVIKKAVEEN